MDYLFQQEQSLVGISTCFLIFLLVYKLLVLATTVTVVASFYLLIEMIKQVSTGTLRKPESFIRKTGNPCQLESE